MEAKLGDRILVESEHVGEREREGEVLEVIEGSVGVRYRVRWRDGRETMLTPAGGAVLSRCLRDSTVREPREQVCG